MNDTGFRALLLTQEGNAQAIAVTGLSDRDLPPGNVTVAVEASTINYKDALVVTAAIPLVQTFPMVPGIDLAGTVLSSDHPRWNVGDHVLANGWGLGERHWGGFSQKARLDGDWLIARPDAFSARQAMAIGTAGYTAMLCVIALERQGVRPSDGDILVTGASGGVGSIAISLLAGRGYRVSAATGGSDEHYLRELGAAEILDRATLAAPGSAMQQERWAGAIDTAGSHTLANICASLRYGGVVAATGIAQGTDLPATMFPFALRGITLCGIDSVMTPTARREEAWALLAEEMNPRSLESISRDVTLDQVPAEAAALLAGRNRGRAVVTL
tara:strand:+ start:1191 stop:2177 length:987 start_codon:yes stop_codon:yes gene_type:complete